MSAHAEASNSMTVEEYLALEETSSVKHEYVGGAVYDLAGALEPHNLIVTNLTVEAALAARGTARRVLGSDMRLRVKADVYYYPDLQVVCDPSDTDPRDKTRPCLIFEVSSPSTMSIDHREKLLAYRGIDTLQTYVIVESASRSVIVHQRGADGAWWRDEYHGDGSISLPCPADFTLTLDHIYAAILPNPGPRRPSLD
jgi:Uma2 family endonuclease